MQDQAPRLTGYSASNQLNVRFRDIAKSGDILDALVAEGANSINGPSLTIDKPEEALDEARAKALGVGRARAELYARALGMRVARLVSVSESGGNYPVPPPMPVMMEARAQGGGDTKIDPGEQKLRSRWGWCSSFSSGTEKGRPGDPGRPFMTSLPQSSGRCPCESD